MCETGEMISGRWSRLYHPLLKASEYALLSDSNSYTVYVITDLNTIVNTGLYVIIALKLPSCSLTTLPNLPSYLLVPKFFVPVDLFSASCTFHSTLSAPLNYYFKFREL